MGICISKSSNKTKPTITLSHESVRSLLISHLLFLQHLINSCSLEIENSLFNKDIPFLILLKQKRNSLKFKQTFIQNLIARLDLSIENSDSKIFLEIQKQSYSVTKELKINPVFADNFEKIKIDKEEQEILKRFLGYELINKEEIEIEAENDLRDFETMIKSGIIRQKYYNLC